MACLRQILDKPPLPKRTSFIESLSWSQIRPTDKPSQASFEVFGEIQFREKPQQLACSPPSSSIPLVRSPRTSRRCPGALLKHQHEGLPADYNDGFSLENSEALQLCTKGLGSKILDGGGGGGDMTNKSPETSSTGKEEEEARCSTTNYARDCRFRRSYSDVTPGSKGRFPPPLTSIRGAGGKPWIYFKSFRDDGRFVLKKISIPTQQCLQATRENGRLVLHSAHPFEGEAQGEDDDDGEEEKAEEEGEKQAKAKAMGIGNAFQSML